MTAEQAEKARKHIHLWDYYKKTGTVLNLSKDIIDELEPIYMYLNRGIKLNRSCKDCLSDMLITVFSTLYQYDKTNKDSKRVEATRQRRPRISNS